MSVLVWLLVPVLIGVAAVAFLAYRNGRIGRGGSMEDEMRQFRRGLDALDPANDPLRRRQLERDQELHQKALKLQNQGAKSRPPRPPTPPPGS
jgi:hypothetical protein